MNFSRVASAFAVSTLALITPAIAQQSGSPLNNIVSKSETLAWKTERDLITILDQSSNRYITAITIISIANDLGNNYTDDQRLDGLKIAGSVLFSDEYYSQAINAYNSALNYTTDEAVEAQMYAAIAESHRSSGNSQLALSDYKTAMDKYLASYAAGRDLKFSDFSTITTLLTLCEHENEHADGYYYAQSLIDLYSTGTLTTYDQMGFVYHAAAKFADYQGNVDDAISAYEALLENFPQYQNKNPVLGLIPNAKVRLQLLKGSTWKTPNADLTLLIIDIFDDPDYDLMPARFQLLESLAHSYDNMGYHDVAMSFRNNIIDGCDSVIASIQNPSSNKLLLNQLALKKTQSKWNSANSYLYNKSDPANALLLLNDIIGADDHPQPLYIEMAEGLKTEIE